MDLQGRSVRDLLRLATGSVTPLGVLRTLGRGHLGRTLAFQIGLRFGDESGIPLIRIFHNRAEASDGRENGYANDSVERVVLPAATVRPSRNRMLNFTPNPWPLRLVELGFATTKAAPLIDLHGVTLDCKAE